MGNSGFLGIFILSALLLGFILWMISLARQTKIEKEYVVIDKKENELFTINQDPAKMPAQVVDALYSFSLLSPDSFLEFKNKFGELKIGDYNSNNDTTLNIFIEKLISHERFNTIFDTALPKSLNDEDLGLNYIPFILNNLERRKKEYKQSSNTFFNALIILGILFTTLVTYFGYLLIDDSKVGINKNITNLNDYSKDLASQIDKYRAEFHNGYITKASIDIYNNQIDLFSLNSPGLISIEGIKGKLLDSLNYTDKKIPSDIVSSFENIFIKKNEIPIDSIILFNDKLDKQTNLGPGLKKESSKINGLIRKYNNYNTQFRDLINNINASKAEISKQIARTDWQISELVKRLSISLVVITFFLAILRYVSKLYTNSYSQLVAVDVEDIYIKKLYIALKNTSQDPEARKYVIQALSNNMVSNNTDNNNPMSISKDESDILKDIVSGILKKL